MPWWFDFRLPVRETVRLRVKIVDSAAGFGRFLPAMALISPYLPPNPLRPRTFGGLGGVGVKKQILSNNNKNLQAFRIQNAIPLPAREVGHLFRLWAFLPVVRLALAGLFLLPPTSAPAQSSPRPVALILCNWKYQHLTPLLTPEADATAMKNVLEELSPAYDVTVVSNATNQEMRDAVAAFTRKHAGNPVVLVYVSGHGLQMGGLNYLTGIDTSLAELDEQVKALRQVFKQDGPFRAQAEGAKQAFAEGLVGVDRDLLGPLGRMSRDDEPASDSHVKMVFLDACREAFPDLAEDHLLTTKSVFGGKGGGGLVEVVQRPGIYVGMSAAANQVSQQNDPDRLEVKKARLPELAAMGAVPYLWRHYDKGGSAADIVKGILPPSFFTERLVASIREGGPLERVFSRAGQAVKQDSRDLVKAGRFTVDQTPANYSLYYGDYEFRRPGTRAIKGENSTAMTPLLVAVLSGKLDLVRQIVETGADVNQPNVYGETPLMYACDDPGRLEIVRFLLEKKAEPNVVVPGPGSALFWAVETGNAEAVALLLRSGARINEDIPLRITEDGSPVPGPTALALAAQNKEWELFDQLLQAGATVTPQVRNLLMALSEDLALIRRHLSKADPKQKGLGEVTLLMACVSNTALSVDTKSAMVKWMLDNGVEVDARSHEDKTALGVACNKGPVEVVRLLLEAKADPNLPSEGRPPLFKTRSIDIVETLLEHGANPEAVCEGKSVLGYVSNTWDGDERDEVIALVTKHITGGGGKRR